MACGPVESLTTASSDGLLALYGGCVGRPGAAPVLLLP